MQPFRDFLCGLRVLTFSIVALSQYVHIGFFVYDSNRAKVVACARKHHKEGAGAGASHAPRPIRHYADFAVDVYTIFYIDFYLFA